MKQLTFIVSMLLLCLNMAHAQAVAPPTNGFGEATMAYTTAGDDTATNTDVISMYAQLNNAYDVTIELVNTRVSGTTGGTAFIEGSMDGVTYYPIKNATTVLALVDTPTVTNVASRRYAWVVYNFPFKYVRLTFSQNTTGVTAPVGKLWYRSAAKKPD